MKYLHPSNRRLLQIPSLFPSRPPRKKIYHFNIQWRGHDLEAMLKTVHAGGDMVHVCNPCNPTGGVLGKSDLTSFILPVCCRRITNRNRP
ncbi:MAG TPA: hypothetical protein ENN79_09490 [Desulfobacteraceae bacterium]|nr:hypothetical protein [Desulfobacteraceae bacterium]